MGKNIKKENENENKTKEKELKDKQKRRELKWMSIYLKDAINFLCGKHVAEYLIIITGVIWAIMSIRNLDSNAELKVFIGKEVCSFLLIICGIVLLMLEKYFEKNKMYFTAKMEGEKKVLDAILKINDGNDKVSLIRELITSEDDK